MIRNPEKAIENLIRRIRAFYANYLSIDALRWYFGDDHILAKARRVLGPDPKVEWMPMAETVAKFHECVDFSGICPKDRAEQIIAAVQDFESVENLSDFASLCTLRI